jgi:hypothetical protein
MSTISNDVVYYGVSRLLWLVTVLNLFWVVAISSHLSMEQKEHIVVYIVGGICVVGFNFIGVCFYTFNLSNDPLTGISVYAFISFFAWVVGLFVNLYRFHKNY